MRIQATTAFDITATGVTGHFREDRLPLTAQDGTKVQDYQSWTRSRNQQRNLETVLQLAQMRSQIDDVSDPVRDQNTGLWSLQFAVERDSVYEANGQPLAALLDDCDSVPIVIGLGESPGCADTIRVRGAEQNIWFQILDK